MNKDTDIDLILDVDETLVHVYNMMVRFQTLHLASGDVLTLEKLNQKLRPYIFQVQILDCEVAAGTGERYLMWGIKRPYLDQFLRFSHFYFNKMILFSAGKEQYVSSVNDQIFPRLGIQPLAIYNSSHTDRINHQTRKPFERLNKYIDPNRSFIIDDQEPAISYNNNRGIHIPQFIPRLNQVAEDFQTDFYLLILIKWFLDRPGMTADHLELPTQDYLVKENEFLKNQPATVKEILRRYDEYIFSKYTSRN